MARAVQAALTFPGSVHEAERTWYEVSRWPDWVDGMAAILSLEGDWPRSGSSVSWQSTPAGRGRVIERVVAHEPLSGQTLEIEDDTIEGRQRVEFAPADGSVEVVLELQYKIKRRSLLTPLIDLLFIRRLMTASLRRTLARFGAELASTRQQGVR